MTINKAEFDAMIANMRIKSLSSEKYEELLNMFTEEPDDTHEWTEQDVYEHIRKAVQ